MAESPANAWPDAVLVAGAPGSGKTTLARAFAAEAQYCLFDLDEVTGPLTEAALALVHETSDALDGPLGRQLRPARYGALLDAARANLALGRRVVVAAPFTDECAHPAALGAATARLAETLAAPVSVVLAYLQTPPALVHQRLARRAATRDRAKIAKGAGPAVPDLPRVPHVRIDGALSLAAQLEALVAALHSSASCGPRSSAC